MGRQNGFQSGGTAEHWKVFLATMFGRQEKVLNFRRSRMSKTVPFWPWWQPFNSFCFENFFLSFPFFILLGKKVRVGWGAECTLLCPSSSVAGPALTTLINKFSRIRREETITFTQEAATWGVLWKKVFL